jgi:hypothetical protein
MSFALSLLCNSWISLIELSSRFIYLYSLYSAVSDMYTMISLFLYLIPCMIQRVNLVPPQRFRYLYVCSSMMSVHLESGVSAWDTRVSLINVVHFQEIANSPSFVYLQPSALYFLCPTCRRSCRPCAAHPPPPRRLSSRHVPPLRPRRRFPGLRWPSPGLSTSRRRRPSRHACHRHRQLLLARAVPLPGLKTCSAAAL